MPKQLVNAEPSEFESNRIRAFLSKVRPLSGVAETDKYWEGRSLIEQLALAFDVQDEAYHWDPMQCAAVLDFMHWIQPAKGTCFCNDDSVVNATCGLHVILAFAADEVRGLAPKAKERKRKRAAVAHG
jgi:hypothetical protein